MPMMKQQHKHKKCMCKHKQKLESAFNGVTIIAGPALTIGGRRGSNVSSKDDNDTEEKPSESRQYATNWWKLKLADRKAHNELMKIQLLSPFLFCKIYQGDPWVCVAKKAGLLSEKRIKSSDDLSDDEIHTTDLMEDTLAKLQERIIEYNNIKPSNKPIYAYLEEILDDIKAVEDTFQILKNPVDHVDTAIKIVYNKHWFKAVRKQLPAKYADKHDYAVFLVAWQVCFYIKSVYQEKPLDVYKNDSELDSDLEVHKQQGNEYFKNEDYTEAIKTYSLILLKKPYLYIIYGNRAACYLKIQKYRLALSDGRRAVALRPQWDKGQYRYAQALYELGNFDETLNVLAKAIKICSSAQLISLQKDVKRSLAEKNSPSLRDDPHITVPKNVAKGNKNGEDVEEQRYANMPELETDNSDNEGESDHSDHETNAPKPNDGDKQLESKKEVAKKKKKKKPRKENQEKNPVPIPMKIKIMSVMQEASKYLLDSKIEFAIREYRKVFSMMQSDPLIITNKEVAILHYALGWAYQESSSTLLQDSLQEFAEIKRKYPNMNFPLSFYGKGIVYHKQNRFKECVVELQEALRLCNLTDCMLNCCWPGVEDIIEVSIPDNFKLAVGHFITLCSHPPRPDAICRYLQCSYRATNIYYTDPDFKGFLRMICTENCFVEFHSSCWKKYKSEQDNHSGEKDFLSSPCLTPDCYGAVWSLQIYDHSKKITKEVNVKDLNSLKKELRQKESNANGAEVPDKKRKKESSICEDNAQHVPKEERQKRSRKSSNLSDKSQDNDDFHKIKNAESASTIHANENHSNSILSEKDSADYFRPSFDISKYNCITDVKSVALNIFTLFEQLLKGKGSIDLGNGAENRNFMNSLDDNSKLLIVQAGSLRSLLNVCPKFAFDTKNKNTVHLSTKEEEGTQKCEDPPLDHEKVDLPDENISSGIDDIDSTKTEIPPITSKKKKNSESSDKDMVSESKPHKGEKNNETIAISTPGNNNPTGKNSKSSKSTNNTPCVNGSQSCSEPEISDDMEVIDCTKSNTDIFAIKSGTKNKKHKKKVSDIIIFNDAKKGGDITCKVIRSPDGPRPEPVSPRKKEKSKGKGYKKIDDHVYKLKHDRPLTPPGEKSNLRTYLEDKIDAEKHNKTPKYCCPLLGNNCSCAEIEKFCDEDGGKTRVRVMKVITIEPEGKESDSDEDSNQAVANALELIHSRNGNQRSRKRSSSSENMCVVEVGIQCDLTNLKKVECDKEKLKMFNEDLIKRLKESQTLNEKLSLEFEKYKEEQTLVIDNKNAENKSHKSSLEKLRKEISLMKSTTQDEVKKVKREVENEYLTKVESLNDQNYSQNKRIDSLDKEKRDLKLVIDKITNNKTKTEGEQKSIIVRKDKELRTKAEELRTKDEEIRKLKMKADELKTRELKTKAEELKTKDDEIKSLKTTREILLAQIEEMKEEHAQENLGHEEIVSRFTNSITEQCNRTQKVQIAFLEVKKEIVAVKYQQQAAIVQNTINQMQFWPMVPEVQNIRSVWDDFKKHFQSCYEKMQEEFRTVIQKVKEGDPLEELPPAQYAEPPPFPKTPMPNNVPIGPSPFFGQPTAPPMANPSAAQSVHIPAPPPGILVPAQRPALALNLETSSSVGSSTVASTVASTSPVSSISSDETTAPVKSTVSSSVGVPSSVRIISVSKSNSSQAAPSTSLPSSCTTKSSGASNETKVLSFASSVKQGFGSDHQTFSSSTVSLKGAPKPVDSSGSSECDDPDEPRRKMFDRIIMRLGSVFPSFSREELRFYVVEYRRMQPQGSLSGMKFDELIMNLEKMIRAMKDAAKAPPKMAAEVSNPRKKFVESDAANRAPVKRTRASHTPAPTKISSQESSWMGTASRSMVPEGYGEEEPCVICYEDMAKESVSKLHCGHIFHRSCITCWLNEQRTCPICRVHALLPEEFPTLG